MEKEFKSEKVAKFMKSFITKANNRPATRRIEFQNKLKREEMLRAMSLDEYREVIANLHNIYAKIYCQDVRKRAGLPVNLED